MAIDTFSDRFSYNNATFAALEASPTFSSSTDAQLFSASAELKEMVEMVRRQSVLISKQKAIDIFYVITNHSDPQIALILASGKDNTGAFLFADNTILKQFMFGGGNPSSGLYVNSQRNVFIEGIRRITVAFAAAELIGRFSQLKEQFDHAEALRKRATEELERIIALPKGETATAEIKKITEVQGFFFERKEFTVPADTELRMSVFMPSISQIFNSWTSPVVYGPGVYHTSQVVSDLADLINESILPTLLSSPTSYAQAIPYSNLLASPILSGALDLHQMKFTARARLLNVAAELVSVKFEIFNMITLQPTRVGNDLYFTWGPSQDQLTNYKLNSLLMVVDNATVERITATQLEIEASRLLPLAIYFRRTGNIGALESSNFKIRIAPISDQVININFPRIIGGDQSLLDSDRPSQLATLLCNELFRLHGETKCLGSLFRNDPDNDNPEHMLAAVELIAWSVTNPEAWIVLDILELPADLEMATGSIQGPATQFSNRPRSIRVESTYKSLTAAQQKKVETTASSHKPRLVSRKKSTYQDVIDKALFVTGQNFKDWEKF